MQNHYNTFHRKQMAWKLFYSQRMEKVGEDFQNEYPTIRIKPNPDCHDRLIVLDYGEETEKVYHCGASSKDAGKKLCAINQITETAIIHPVIDRLLSLPDKQI